MEPNRYVELVIIGLRHVETAEVSRLILSLLHRLSNRIRKQHT